MNAFEATQTLESTAEHERREVEELVIEASSVHEAHERLGEALKEEIRAFAAEKLDDFFEEDEFDVEAFSEIIKYIRLCNQRMDESILENTEDTPHSREVREAYDEYKASLASWTKGADLQALLKNYRDGELASLMIDGTPLTAEDIAWWLQNENVGCQTGMYRLSGGEVLFWHTEEEDMEMEHTRLIRTRVIQDGKTDETVSFSYPQLLPGGAFTYADGYFQAVDYLYQVPEEPEGGAFANAAVWMVTQLRDKVPPQEVVQSLSPYIDGYAINIVRREGDEVRAEKVLFGKDAMSSHNLPKERGEYLYQNNMFGDTDTPVAKYFEDPENEKEAFDKREEVNIRSLRALRSMDEQDTESTANPAISPNFRNLTRFARLMSSGIGEYPYASPEDGLAYTVGVVSSKGMEVWTGAGVLSKAQAREFKRAKTRKDVERVGMRVWTKEG